MQFYTDFTKAKFIRRINRFVMELLVDGAVIQAYVPNTGRMSEFQVADHPFFLVKSSGSKFSYKVISTLYQGNYVFLDTVKVNDIFDLLLKKGYLSRFFPDITFINREHSILNSRFDFHLRRADGNNSLVEVKSCTLIHNGIAMFPDAPTLRGQKHIRELQELAEKEYDCHVVFLIMNGSAERFFPNFHTDYEYGQAFLHASKVRFHALSLNLRNPISIDLRSIKDIPIEDNIPAENCFNRGNYLLLLENSLDFSQNIGKLGKQYFPGGYYIYVGSAMNSLDSRIKRHYSRRKKQHWHIDYIIPYRMSIIKSFPLRRSESIESKLAEGFETFADSFIPDFGSSDSVAPSHLFYFQDNPIHNRNFLDILMNAYTFTI
ncbi:MAG: DNA/RNA nuclease SfsA [Candidatus Marinimicrobia bacterium]|nr:DNA/RNA nuclease SfsA [Candidatus Neomarinimicrobiota bacterium]